MKKEKQNIPGWYVFFSIMCCMALFFIGMIVGENQRDSPRQMTSEEQLQLNLDVLHTQLDNCQEAYANVGANNPEFYEVGRQVLAHGPQAYCREIVQNNCMTLKDGQNSIHYCCKLNSIGTKFDINCTYESPDDIIIRVEE